VYVCICNAITEKMLEENDYYYHLLGSKCGKCSEEGSVKVEKITYLTEDRKET